MYFFIFSFIKKLYIFLYFIRYFQDIKTYIILYNMSYSLNNINEIIYENIIRLNPTYDDDDIIQNNKYYIGLCSIDNYNNFIISCILPLNIFHIYNYNQLLNYLLSYSIMENNWKTIEIVKIYFNTNDSFITYNCVIKTYFIRLLQKKWKYYLKKRNKYLHSYKIINDLRDREIGKIKKITF